MFSFTSVEQNLTTSDNTGVSYFNVFSRKATSFHRPAKAFEGNFFIRKTFLF